MCTCVAHACSARSRPRSDAERAPQRQPPMLAWHTCDHYFYYGNAMSLLISPINAKQQIPSLLIHPIRTAKEHCNFWRLRIATKFRQSPGSHQQSISVVRMSKHVAEMLFVLLITHAFWAVPTLAATQPAPRAAVVDGLPQTIPLTLLLGNAKYRNPQVRTEACLGNSIWHRRNAAATPQQPQIDHSAVPAMHQQRRWVIVQP